ncbi:histidine phosphatase family protein [Acidithiobacillus ferriphilus]|uniref:histidine phosphatase family protein n=1 Tax=Acidithiobacillus TaxID=119977 RepID=UPI001C065E11|nr:MULTISPECIES: histidine phosphatase family protein [Acidithiobacillus]MBU2849463.1 histidine phosphatase family protein [Acidithiobacillus ferriphilus]MDA8247308.1 histidine phosphatase family protein [Acidithiobacillus sp.]MEB8537269.1 histidine phosphatase family protein [Acidithiobacillus ferriphilus]
MKIESITLVRHGMTAWSDSGKHTSVTDVALTAEGRVDAQALWGSFVEQGHFDGVYSSPMLRARHTAILAGFADPELHQGLCEWRYGRYEGMTTAEIRRENPKWSVFRCGGPGGESPEAVSARCDGLLEEWDEKGHRHVLCFAHGHILRALAARWLGLELRFGEHLHLDPGSISCLGWEHEVPALHLWNYCPQRPVIGPRAAG